MSHRTLLSSAELRRSAVGTAATATDAAAARGTGTGTGGSIAKHRYHAQPPWTIDAVIDNDAIRTLFQPVVHLASGAIVGFEALSRGPAGSLLETPMALLAAAAKVGRLGELDWLCRTQATRAAADADLHPDLSWLINVEPAGLVIDCPPRLAAEYMRSRTKLRVILEVVERDVEAHVADLLYATDQARRDSWGIALDDVGADQSSLALLPFLRPDVVKLDMSLVRSAPCAAAAAITAAVRAYAERTGAVILAEGIETLEQEQLAQVFGATYGQGFRYGRPGPLPSTVPAPGHVIPRRGGLVPLCGRTPFEVLTATSEPQRARRADLLHISQHLEHQAASGAESSVVLACFQDRSYFSASNQRRYHELAQLNAFTVVLAAGLDAKAEPRFRTAPIGPGTGLEREWIVIVISPHYAAAFVARDREDTLSDGERQFDYVFTHDRDCVIAAARSFLQNVDRNSVTADDARIFDAAVNTEAFASVML
ncbi:sensor domain-containing phosphodiesterase [Jatrophihabitans sp. DSM 45814]